MIEVSKLIKFNWYKIDKNLKLKNNFSTSDKILFHNIL